MSNNFWKLTFSLCLGMCFYTATVNAASGPVGSVDGSFSVTPGGAATYSIPIKVPTGIGSIKPAISLTYSSQAGNGLLGVGWNISGLSTITRCPQNLAQDGQIRAVKLDADDKYCLDGQRLVAVSGIYGQSNTEYRTEQDIFSKIISRGFLDNGPETFEVLTKDGLRMQFGNVSVDANGQYDSRFAPHGKEVVHIWAISSIADNAGNIINFTYQFTGDDSSGLSSSVGYNREYYPNEINYSGGGKISFNYGVAGNETRPDPIVGYRAGGKVQTTKRLEKISVEIASQLVRDYKVAYEPTDVNSNKSKLTTVIECGTDGLCFPATQIGWQLSHVGTTAWQSDTTYQLPAGLELSVDGEDIKGILFIDLNGDGFKDIIYHRWNSDTSNESGAFLNKNGTWEQADSYLPPYPLSRIDNKPTGSRIIDVNGDGLVDFVWSRWVSDTQTDQGAYINNGAGWSLDTSGKYVPKHWLGRDDGRDRNQRYLDLDGNGLVDQIYNYYDFYDADVECDYVFGNPVFCTPTVTYSDKGAFLNFSDAWAPNLDYFLPQQFLLLSTGDRATRFISNEKVISVQGQHSLFIDINGDSLPDYIVDDTFLSEGPDVYLNTGSGLDFTSDGVYEDYADTVSGSAAYKLPVHFIDDVDRNTGIRKTQGVAFHDVNGDGLVDILKSRQFFNGAAPEKSAYLNTGDGWVRNDNFIPPVALTVIGSPFGRQVYFRDVNNDGLVDIIFQEWINPTDETRGAYLNTGTGWIRNDTFSPPDHLILSDWKDAGTRLVDLNSDGKVDIIRSYRRSAYSQDEYDSVLGQNVTVNYPEQFDEVVHSISVNSQIVNSITAGFGTTTGITYKSLTDPSVYTKGTNNCQYPTPCIISPISVVSEHSVSNGIGGAANYTYKYTDARINNLGHGWLGFASRSITDVQTQRTTTTTYENTNFNSVFNVFPYLNMPKKITVSYADSTLGDIVTSETINNYAVKSVAGNPYYSVYLESSTSEEKDLDGAPVKYTETTTVMDDYGNATDITVDTKQSPLDTTFAYRQTTHNTYDNDTANWHLGRLTASSVTSFIGADSQTRNTAFGYYPAGHVNAGMLHWSEDEPTDPDLYLKTEYTYDAFGNKDTVTVSGSSSASYPVATRTTTSNFDYTDNQFPAVTTTVPVEGTITQSETKVYDARWGKLKSQTGPNGLTTSWLYDSFGRRSSETRPDGTTVTMTYGWCDATDTSCPALAVYKVTTVGSDGAISIGYMDEFSRQLRAETRGLDGVIVHQDTEYDALGRVWRTSRPYFKDATKFWTTREFDALSRVEKQTNPDGSTVTNVYSGLQTMTYTERHSNGAVADLTVRQIMNLSGKVALVYDAYNNKTEYTYYPFGELKTVTPNDTAANAITMEYDKRGRKTQLIDPDMGTWQYDTDALGNLRWQKDNIGQQTTMSYDLLNRMRTRVDVRNPADSTSVEKTSQWVYFTEADAAGSCRSIGKLKSTTDGAITKSFCYDSLGRITSATSNFDNASYTVATAYDTFSRVETITYPAQDAGNQPAFIKRNVYDSFGHLKEVQDGASNDPLWTAELVNASGKITSESLGNGLTTLRVYDDELGFLKSISTGTSTSSDVQNLEFGFDNLGNLVSRTDHNRVITLAGGSTRNGTTESFTYDILNRIDVVKQDGIQTANYRFDALGNMTFNSNVGTYLYTGANGAGPHAVTEIQRITSQAGIIAGDVNGDGSITSADTALLARNLVGLDTTSLTTSADCNVDSTTNIHDTACISANIGQAAVENITYDANGNMQNGLGGKVITYTAFNKPKSITKGSHSTRFEYGADRSRYLQEATDAEGTTKTHYMGQLFERIVKPGGIIEYKNYIYAGSRVIGVTTRRSNNTTDLHYLHGDHINSTSVITDANGIVKERFSYDVFGKRRSNVSWKAASTTESIILAALTSSVTHHGFTEHELLEGVGLIHMNGRVYDPQLGRFLSADPLVQAQHNLQSYNRYTYVMNNPLSYTDPSGFRTFFDNAWDTVTGIADDLGQGLWDLSEDIFDFIDENGTTIIAIGIAAIPGVNVVAAGFMSSLIASGGDLRAAVIGGITAGAFAGVGDAALAGAWGSTSKVLAHGMVGGVSSVMNGGSFKAGFISAAVTQTASVKGVFGPAGVNPVQNAFKAALVGGTASVLAGGKFKNGAMTGAFSRMFNDELHPVIEPQDSLSGFEIDQEGAVEIYKKMGLKNLPDPLNVTTDGLNLADDMLVSAVGADDLVGLLEPSPIQKLRAIPLLKKLFTNTGDNGVKNYWRDTISEVNVGMAARAGIQYNTDLMHRYNTLYPQR
ncbi:MAG: RHS repeat-associated core domain-containing protein [Gammaproteobacteria bacterium]|nr:RHS repeat-associated core domain-containing protein [Gammaproteobacteria bacterium]